MDDKKYPLFDVLIRQNISFALYRLPGQGELNLVLQRCLQAQTLDALTTLKKGFLIAPFKPSKTAPIVLINPDTVLTGEKAIFAFLNTLLSAENARIAAPLMAESPSVMDDIPCEASTFEHYQGAYELFHDKLLDGTFKKLVLSRTLVEDRACEFSPGMAFKRACDSYPSNFIYLCHSPASGTWLGCSPELLLSGEKGSWKTDALAGTQDMPEPGQEVIWDEKNRLEQQIVVEYMQKQLLKAHIESCSTQSKTIQSGSVIHLKSEVSFEMADSSTVGHVLSLLHPSPAVCGFPKEEAFDFIVKNEGYDRRYYSGFLGYFDGDAKTQLFVNLRCMQIGQTHLKLFAGGGILPSSTLMSEWHETQSKLKTVLSIIDP